MQRRSQFLTFLVCFVASSALANAAFAQFAGANWKRWDWSFLYPVDETSSAVARFLGAETPREECSIGWFDTEPEALSGDEFDASSLSCLGKCQIASFASQFSRGTRWCHFQLLAIASEFRTTWEGTLAELKSQGELIYCARAVLLATESQRRSEEYWRYYEDRNRWMSTIDNLDNSESWDWKVEEIVKSRWLDELTERLLDSLSRTPREQISGNANRISFMLDRTALSALELKERLASVSGWLPSSQKAKGGSFRLASSVLNRGENSKFKGNSWLCNRTIQCGETFVTAITLETCQAIDDIQTAVSNLFKAAVDLLGRLPVEAIGHVFAE